jgi:hypothetical protein
MSSSRLNLKSTLVWLIRISWLGVSHFGNNFWQQLLNAANEIV